MILIGKIEKCIYSADAYGVYSLKHGRCRSVIVVNGDQPNPLKTIDYIIHGDRTKSTDGKQRIAVSRWEKAGTIPAKSVKQASGGYAVSNRKTPTLPSLQAFGIIITPSDAITDP